jgi:predicted ATPase
MPTGATLSSLGEHRFKDLRRPELVFQLMHPGLPATFPPLNSPDAYPNNLPIQLTSFIGREREIGEVRELLSTARLVTLTGSGGTGKTRLALQAAAEALPSFPDGVWLVELASLADPAGVLPAVAAALDLQGLPGMQPIQMVTGYLRAKRALLILDNCEHLIEACAELADHLLRACPALKLIASSREGLGIGGEVTFHVPSLGLPPEDNPPAELLLGSEAVQLFAERAGAAKTRFRLTLANLAAVVQICRRLDGIPLAIELAAARVRLFTPQQIADRLNDRFRLLTGGSRTALPRQQTLRAMIDWSYDLLSEPEKALLRRLTLFTGGWTFEAAEAVCADLDVLSRLEQLVNKSLVLMEEVNGQARYSMLETIRQYGREKLVEAGEAVEMRNHHLDYFLALALEAEAGLRGGQSFEWFDRLTPENDNLEAAMEWGREQRPEDALLMIGSLMFFWPFRGNTQLSRISQLVDLVARVESLPEEGSGSGRRARALARGVTMKGLLYMSLGDLPAARSAYLESARLAKELGDDFGIIFSYGNLTNLDAMTGNWEAARTSAREVLDREHFMGDERWLIMVLPVMVVTENQLGNPEKSRQYSEKIRRLRSKVDHPLYMPVLLGLANHARDMGRLDEARETYLEGLKIAGRLGSRPFATVMESELAHLERTNGNWQAAGDAYRKLIRRFYEYGVYAAVAHQLECLAFVARQAGDPARSACLLGAAEAIRAQIHIDMRPIEREEYERELAGLRAELDPDTLASAWAQGRALNIEQAVEYAASSKSERGSEG